MERPVIDFIEKEHVYLVDGVPKSSVTEILKPITASGYGAIHPGVVEYARERGSMIHELTQMIDYGDQPFVSMEIRGYIKAYLTFLRDYQPEWHGIETIVYDPIRDVCGTVDRYGMINGKRSVVDIKNQAAPSVENKISVCAQTAEYSRAIEWDDADRYALYLHSDGTYTLMDCIKYEKKKGFLGSEVFDDYLNIFRKIERIKSNGKRSRSL